MSTVRLIDGTEVDSASEAYRHECEARTIAARPTLDERRAYLHSVEQSRGKTEADRLRTTMGLIWDAKKRQKGNKA
jgi:hypothetical protein